MDSSQLYLFMHNFEKGISLSTKALVRCLEDHDYYRNTCFDYVSK